MGTGLDCYKFGRKNNWRRTVWNEAVKRLRDAGKEIKNCTVLYLPGAENEDGRIAIEKGFKPWNLYAVENNADRVKDLRKNNINVIYGDFIDIIKSWVLKEKIDFIFADFCGGITKTAERLIIALEFCDGISEKCVVAVNLLRGRDKGIRNVYESFMSDIGLHRGEQFYRIFLVTNMQTSLELQNKIDLSIPYKLPRWIIYLYCSLDREFFIPRFLNYKSIIGKATLNMDSVIFNWGTMANFVPVENKIWGISVHASSSYVRTTNTKIITEGDLYPEKNKIFTAKTINTMKKNNINGMCF